MTKFLVVDDHPLFCDALIQVIREYYGEVEIFLANTLEDAISIATSNSDLDLILLDLYMPGSVGFSGLVSVRNAAPTIPVTIISASEEPDIIRRGLTCGAVGYITKSSTKEDITGAINIMLEGGTYVPDILENADLSSGPRSTIDHEFLEKFTHLSPAELNVLQELTVGKTNKVIAFDLNVQQCTIKAHISSIFRKLGVNNRTQAVLAVQQLDLL